MAEQHEKALVPQIRFTSFTDPWEQRKLGELEKQDVLHLKRGIVISAADMESCPGNYPVYSSSASQNGEMGKYGKYMFNQELVTWSIDGGGSVFYRPKHKFSVTNVCGYVETSSMVDCAFLAYQMGYIHSQIHFDYTVKAHPSVIRDLYTLSWTSLTEQRRIGAFFDRLDSLITLHQRKYDKLCVLKKSMLDKMFPKGGSLYPEIRFAGFTDPWEQRKLGELCSFSKGCGYSKNDLRDQGTPIILYGRLYTNYETQIHSVDTFVKPLENSVYSEGGEVIIPASGETAEDISIASVVEKPGIILGGDLNVITSSADIDPVFLALELSYGKPHFDLAKRAQGKSVVHIHNEDIANVFFGHPNIAEQRQIGAFFDRLDSLITLHQRKLELLRNIKKSMLDKMFV